MNKVVVYALSAVAGVLVFGSAYIGFAKMRGVPANALPVVGGLFPHAAVELAPPIADVTNPTPPPESKEPAATPTHATPAPVEPSAAAASTHETPAPVEPSAAATTTHAPTIPIATPTRPNPKLAALPTFEPGSIFSKSELDGLADTLRAKLREANQRLAAIAAQETLFADRGITLDERQKMLEDLRASLEIRERELRAREAELPVTGPDGAKVTPIVDPAAMGPFFAEGDVSDLAKRLAGYEAPAAAKILAKLSPERARELLDALPTAKWREYAEAYIAATTVK